MLVSLPSQGWNQLYTQSRKPQGVLSSRFTLKAGGIYSGQKVSMDIERLGEKIAPVVRKIHETNHNDFSEFDTITLEPPIYGESFSVDAIDLINRAAGQDPYSAAYKDATSQIVTKFARGFTAIDAKIQRAMELQASQILQTGKLSLDSVGEYTFELDYQARAEHFPKAATPWADAKSKPLDDIAAVAEKIRSNGKISPNRLTFGAKALSYFLAHPDVIEAMNLRRAAVIDVNPTMSAAGGTYHGKIWIGSYEYEMWTYPEEYETKDGAMAKYVSDSSVIIDSTETRYDMVIGVVPTLASPDPRISGMMPSQLGSADFGFVAYPNAYIALNNRSIVGELHSRVLLVPTQIDGFGCITVE